MTSPNSAATIYPIEYSSEWRIKLRSGWRLSSFRALDEEFGRIPTVRTQLKRRVPLATASECLDYSNLWSLPRAIT